MTNHYHIVVETAEGNLSKGMRQLNGVYTQHINRTYRRVGHVFQGRYKAILIEKDSYLLEVSRYVVLNPVRAGMVNDAGQWDWSSYRAMLGAAAKPVWLETDWLLGQFGSPRVKAVEGYQEFVRRGRRGLWDELRNQVFLGGTEFVSRMQHLAAGSGELREVPRAQRRPKAKRLDEYMGLGRNGLAQAYLSGDYTMREIADHCGIHYSTVSRIVRDYELERDVDGHV
jgi:hypothetical protein